MANINVDVGKLYEVTFDSGDVYGSFISRLARIEKVSEEYYEFHFENGICITNKADCTTTEVQEEDAKP